MVTGDFNADGKTDIALVRQEPGWGSVPVALSRGDGRFEIVNHAAGEIARHAASGNVRVLTGDFSRDVTVANLPRWGANPRHKDVFVEVDYTTRFPNMPLTEADAEAIRDYFAVGSPNDLKNPDGRPGIAVHLDLGITPQNPGNQTLFGDWGGSNAIPLDHPDKFSFRNQQWRGVFLYGILDAGGQARGDAFAASVLGGTPRNNVRTFVHELGHVLNLEHEGGSGVRPLGHNCSPVYPSIMNYAGQYMSGAWGDVGFSTGREYPGVSVNPSRLCEAAGLNGADVSHLANYGIPTQGSAIDWNRDGRIDSCNEPVRARVNWFAPMGCPTHIMGRFAQNEATLVSNGNSPSIAQRGDYLYLYYIGEDGRIRYRWGRQGARWPQSGCPLGFPGSAEASAKCTDWEPETTTAEQDPVSSVTAFAVDGRMYLAYVKPGNQTIQVLISTGFGADGRISGWMPVRSIAQSSSSVAPGLGLLYDLDQRNRTVRKLIAIWPDQSTNALQSASLDLAGASTTFSNPAALVDAQGNSVPSNGAPVSLAFWGRDTGAPPTNQTWIAFADAASHISLMHYDAATARWRDRTTAAFGFTPNSRIRNKVGIAFRPILDASGNALDPLRGEFTLVYGFVSQHGNGRIWISDVVDAARPPDQHLSFPSRLSGRFGHAWFTVAVDAGSGFDLFSSPSFPFLKGAVVHPCSPSGGNACATRKIAFFTFADGIFDRDFQTGSDFQVMERGICLALHNDSESVCGPPNEFGY